MDTALRRLETVQACDLCGNADFEPILAAQGWHLVRCRSCRLVMTSPRQAPQSLVELYKQSYYEHQANYAEAQIQRPREDDLRLIRSLEKVALRRGLNGPFRGLDIGCGHGRLVAAMNAVGWTGAGIEPSQLACRTAQAAGRDVRQGDFESYSWDEKFSAVMAFHVLEHVLSPRRFLQRCREILLGNGLLLLEVPDFDCHARKKMGADWPCLFPDVHLHQFTRPTLNRYLRETGFQPIRWHRVNGRGFLRSATTKAAAPATAGVSESGPPRSGSMRDRLFSLRHAVYWIPGIRPLARQAFWEVLGYGEALRVLARRT